MKMFTCPRCDKVRFTLTCKSSRDRKTEICTLCATEEQLYDRMKAGGHTAPLDVLGREERLQEYIKRHGG